MYQISEGQLQQVTNEIAKRDAKIEKLTLKARASRAAGQARIVGEIVGTGLIMGAVRGKLESPDGTFNIPGVNFDAELAIGLAITGAGLLMAQSKGKQAKYADDALTVGSAILGSFARGVAKHWGKTGQFAMTGIGGALPPVPQQYLDFGSVGGSVGADISDVIARGL